LGSLQSAIEIRNAINDILGRYDCNPEYYENDPRIDATCAILAENAVTFGCREGAALAAKMTPAAFKAARLSLGLTAAQAAPLFGLGDPARIFNIEGANSAAVPAWHGLLMQSYIAGYRPADWPPHAAPIAAKQGDTTQ
jgi:hypothetical protein